MAVIQRCTAFEDEVEEHRRRRTEAAEGEEVEEQEVSSGLYFSPLVHRATENKG